MKINKAKARKARDQRQFTPLERAVAESLSEHVDGAPIRLWVWLAGAGDLIKILKRRGVKLSVGGSST